MKYRSVYLHSENARHLKKFVPRSEKTRLFIIEKTAILFNKKGVEGTTLTDLTEATKLTKGSIYGNFVNKEEVALEAFKYNFNQLGKRINSFVSKEKHSLDQLFALSKFYRNDFKMMSYLGGCPLLNTAVDTDDTNAVLKAQVIGAFEAVIGLIAEIIKNGQTKNELNTKVEAKKYATLFFELLEGGVLLSKTTGKKEYLYEACDRIDKMINDELKP